MVRNVRRRVGARKALKGCGATPAATAAAARTAAEALFSGAVTRSVGRVTGRPQPLWSLAVWFSGTATGAVWAAPATDAIFLPATGVLLLWYARRRGVGLRATLTTFGVFV